MVRRALERASGSAVSNAMTFAVADVTSFRSDARFDSVISLFHVVSYQTTNSAVSRMFAVASQHLRSGGVFVFDVWYGPAVLEQKPSVRIKRLEDSNERIVRVAEPVVNSDKNTVEVRYSMFCVGKQREVRYEFEERHIVRYFFLPELDLMLGQAGFKLEKAEEWLTSAPASPGTWSVTVVARKS